MSINLAASADQKFAFIYCPWQLFLYENKVSSLNVSNLFKVKIFSNIEE